MLGAVIWLAAAPASSAPPELLARPGSWSVGVSAVYAYLVLDDQLEPEGGGAELFASYQLSPTFSIRLAGLWSAHTVEQTDERAGGTIQVISAGASLAYAVDLLRWRPQIEVGIEILHRRLIKSTPTDAGIKVGLAIDYPIYRWLLVGGAAYYHGFITSPAEIPVYVALGPRISLAW